MSFQSSIYFSINAKQNVFYIFFLHHLFDDTNLINGNKDPSENRR